MRYENDNSSETGPPPLIDGNMGIRLRRFDECCEISMVRTPPLDTSPWATQKRVWVVTMRPHQDGSGKSVSHDHPILSEALRRALEEAERRGWNQ